MANIEKRKGKFGTTYRVKIRIKGHPAISQTFNRQGDALNWAEETEAALRGGAYVGDTPPGDMPFEEALNKYIDHIQTAKKIVGKGKDKKLVPLKKINTVLREVTAAERLHKEFDSFSLREITSKMCAKYRDKRLLEASVSTFLKEMFVFNNVFKLARTEWEIDIDQSPFKDIQTPSQGEGRLRFLTVEEAVALYENSKESKNNKFHTYVLLMLQSGMRPGEAAGLTWGKVNLEKRYIDLTVTKTRPRLAPLTVPACQLLKTIRPDDWETEDFVFLPEKPSNYVLRQPYRYFRRAFENALKKAGINDFTQHDMRHTAASHLLMTEKVDLITLSNILGHTSLDMTRRYAHMLMEHKLKAIDRIAHLGLENETI